MINTHFYKSYQFLLQFEPIRLGIPVNEISPSCVIMLSDAHAIDKDIKIDHPVIIMAP